MMRYATRVLAVLVATVSAVGYMGGCATTEPEGELVENRAPRVWLSAAPPEGTVEKYTIHMYWGGWDPDGEIAYYEYAITDNAFGMSDPTVLEADSSWHRVAANDSTFLFSADELQNPSTTNMVSEFRRSHTFYIRSVDEQGVRSPEPAHRSFTARTLSPEVRITIPRRSGSTPALVPGITTFVWRAIDYVDNLLSSQDPDSVQYALVSARDFERNYNKTLNYLINDPEAEKEWQPWMWYKAPGDSGKTLTTEPLNPGRYVFAIRAMDEAGAVTPVLDRNFNVRFMQVAPRSQGPYMTLANEFLGTVSTASCSHPITILDIPAGVPLSFAWCATAEHYGAIVTKYRYGWDISDLSDPDQWEQDYTPFSQQIARSPDRTFFFGTHTFTVEIVDNNGFCSRVEVKVNVIQFSFSRDVLLVDDFKADEEPFLAGWTNPRGKGVLPNNEEHDAFWREMVDNAAGFNPNFDEVRVEGGGKLELTQIAPYKSIIWSVFGDVASTEANTPLLYDFIKYRKGTSSGNFCPSTTGGGTGGGKTQANLLRLFMAAGGHVLITGQHPVANSINRIEAGQRFFPFLFRFDVEGDQNTQPNVEVPIGDQTMGYLDLCVDVLDFAFNGTSRQRNVEQVCPTTSVRPVDSQSKRTDTMRSALVIDPNFPPLNLRAEAAGPGRFYETAQGLDVEVYNPTYFFSPQVCLFSPNGPRPCFEPIYGLDCLDTNELTYGEAVAFWTSTYADVVPDIPGGLAARSAVFGFAPVMFNPDEAKLAIEYILFDEWKLARKP